MFSEINRNRLLKKTPRILQEQDGFTLGLVLVFFLIFTIIGYSYIQLSALEGFHVINYYEKVKAFYYAESGINKGLWLLNQVSIEQVTFSDSTVSVVYDTTNKAMVATGMAGNANYSIRISTEQDYPFRHVISYQSTMDFGSQAELYFVPGADTMQTLHFPVPDMTFYQSLADTIYDLGGGSVTFEDDTLYGIIYVNGEVKVHHGFVLYGSLIATGSVKFAGKSEIYAQQVPITSPYYPAYYPALIGSNAEPVEIIGTPTQIIYGSVYTSGLVDVRGGFLTGPIVGDNVRIRNNSTISDLGSSIYYIHPPGFIYPGNIMGDWIIKSGSWEKI